MTLPTIQQSKTDVRTIGGQEYQEYIGFYRAAQITWWSILQGISVVYLVEEIIKLLTLFSESEQSTLSSKFITVCLYLSASFINVVNAWVQMAWGVLISRWEIRVPHAILTLIAGVALAITVKYVTNPIGWFSGIVVVIFSAMLIHIYNRAEVLIEDYQKRDNSNLISLYFFYFSVGIILLILIIVKLQSIDPFFGIAALSVPRWAVWESWLQPDGPFFGIAALTLCVSGLWIQARRIGHYRNKFNAQVKGQVQQEVPETVKAVFEEKWKMEIYQMLHWSSMSTRSEQHHSLFIYYVVFQFKSYTNYL